MAERVRGSVMRVKESSASSSNGKRLSHEHKRDSCIMSNGNDNGDMLVCKMAALFFLFLCSVLFCSFSCRCGVYINTFNV